MGERWTPPDRFRPDELDGDATAGDQARVMATARELEWLAAADDVTPSAGFADRVMEAVVAEPTPHPVAAAASAARRGAILGIFASFGDLWRVAWTGGRPMAVRAPAMALVVLVMAATLGAGALGVGALGRLLDRPAETAPPTQVASPSPAVPSPSSSPTLPTSPTPSPTPTASPGASETPEASESPEPSETPEASESPESEGSPAPTSKASATPRPTETPMPTETPRPTETPKPGETPGD